ncbi:hypothetical protein CEY02_20000 [Bacillus pumilus]|uniref:Uncharacterized protein n=1 Tax=Bacillus pumilus TaxID=1408 RepID=A0A2A5IJE7_BACPU|nr:hypothetical protein [Bacillus pumilus]PCK17435.1 hypothetical protein CEY02_20000 [Bacillus pumilus]
MFLLDIVVDIIANIYISLGYGTPQRKINVKIDKISKVNPEIKRIYENDKAFFEEDPKLSKLILESKVNTRESKEQLSHEISMILKEYKHVR